MENSYKLPVITVITVVLNGARFLEETINSITSQSYPCIEYIIVDGASNDGTLGIIKKYEKFIDYWISEKDNGIYDAMNKGVSRATGSWIIFINSGDILTTNFSLVASRLDSLKIRVKAVLCKVNVCDESGAHIKIKSPSKLNNRAFLLGMPVCHQGILYKRSTIADYDDKYTVIADKVHLYKMYTDSQKSLCIIPIVISKYRLGGFSEKMRKIYYDEEARFFAKVTRLGKVGEYAAMAYLWLKYLIFQFVVRFSLKKSRRRNCNSE